MSGKMKAKRKISPFLLKSKASPSQRLKLKWNKGNQLPRRNKIEIKIIKIEIAALRLMIMR
jgi:hypothetical protein